MNKIVKRIDLFMQKETEKRKNRRRKKRRKEEMKERKKESEKNKEEKRKIERKRQRENEKKKKKENNQEQSLRKDPFIAGRKCKFRQMKTMIKRELEKVRKKRRIKEWGWVNEKERKKKEKRKD